MIIVAKRMPMWQREPHMDASRQPQWPALQCTFHRNRVLVLVLPAGLMPTVLLGSAVGAAVVYGIDEGDPMVVQKNVRAEVGHPPRLVLSCVTACACVCSWVCVDRYM